jgi:hypothetical protein
MTTTKRFMGLISIVLAASCGAVLTMGELAGPAEAAAWYYVGLPVCDDGGNCTVGVGTCGSYRCKDGDFNPIV